MEIIFRNRFKAKATNTDQEGRSTTMGRKIQAEIHQRDHWPTGSKQQLRQVSG